ncbi:recombinase family protein [Corynebacterium glyciniphilum]|uniref:recombinase family protein n=1 Tax=Corynebacterium glyciniphilum TaxID=1404244 RepID=UPI003FD2B6E2
MTRTPGRRAAIYARISESRDRDTAGVDRQEQLCRTLAEKHGLTVTDVYTDLNRSAWSGQDRPEFQRLMGDMSRGVVDVVLAYAPDRLSRSLDDYAAFTGAATRARRRVILVNGGEMQLGDHTATLSNGVQALVSSWESGIKSARVTAASKDRALAGHPPGGARKFGYTSDHRDLVDREADALRRVVTAVLAGESIRSQAKALNAAGILTPSRTGHNPDGSTYEKGCKPWQTGSLRTTLLRPALAGIVTYKGNDRDHQHRDVPAQWPAIITVAEHDTLVSMLTNPERRTNGKRGRAPSYLGTGLYRCGAEGCGHTMGTTFQNRPAGRVKLYRCRFGNERLGVGERTPHVARRLDLVDDVVQAAVIARLARGDVQSALAAAQGQDTAELVAERERVRAAMDEIAPLVVSGAFTPAQAAEMNKGYLDRLEALDVELSASDGSGVLEQLPDVDAADPQAATRVADWWFHPDTSLETRRAVLDAIVTVTILPQRRGRRFDPDSIDYDWKV